MIDFRAATAGTAESLLRTVIDGTPVLVGTSPASDQLRKAMTRAAAADGPVLVVGERGSGRSLVARALHEHGERAARRCAVVHCNDVPASQLDAELFGGVSGGGRHTSEGRGALELSEGGTVILEHVETSPVPTQMRLARFFESGLIEDEGRKTRVNTRVIATCTEAPTGGREYDPALWARLTRHTVRVPSLRERQADIPTLAQFFASGSSDREEHVAFASEALHALCAYPWPGNVAQLRRVVEHLVSAGHRDSIQASDLPVGIRPRRAAGRSGHQGRVTVGEQLFARVQRTGDSFWSIVYPLFMNREITRRDLRDLIRRALDVARDNRDDVVRVLNMPVADRGRFEKFLRKYDCELAPRDAAGRD
jgi:DNA-binding NtrC family response regulator